MKKLSSFLATILVASFSCFGQQIITVNWNHKQLDTITSNSDFGNLMPIDTMKGIINIGFAQLALIDYRKGEILSLFQENQLYDKFTKLIETKYDDKYSIYTSDELTKLPYCERQRFKYRRLYSIEKENIFACEVECKVKNIETINNFFVNILVFFNEKLDILSIHEREKYNGDPLASDIGGFFKEKTDFFIKKAVPTLSEENAFVHFKLEKGIYRLQPNIGIIKVESRRNYFPGRHFSAFFLDEINFIYNGTDIFTFQDLFEQKGRKKILLDLKDDEQISVLRPLNNKKNVGIKSHMDEDGVCLFADFILLNSDFREIKTIKSYDERYITVNSMEVYGNTVILLLFDRKKEVYLIEVIEIKN